MGIRKMNFVVAIGLFLFFLSITNAQTTAFNYQGKLTDGGNPANANYEMQFRLYDNPNAGQGTQQGATVSFPSVTVANGIFSVSLDFGTAVFASGADRFLEISLRPAGSSGGFTSLAPRQKLLSSPYSVRSINSSSADSLTTACVGCVQNLNINTVDGNKITGTVANSTNSTNSTNAANANQLGNLPPSRYVQLDTNGNVSIGTTGTGSKLTVAGVIESTTGGIKFPDATVQTTAGLTTVTTNSTLTGNGTTATPLGVASPILVRDLDNPARQPFQMQVTADTNLVTVPTGKLLVIEYVSAYQINTNDTTGSSGAVYLRITQTNLLMGIPPTLIRQTSSVNTYAFNIGQQVRLYVTAGQTLRLEFSFLSISNSRFATVVGYYVDVP